MIDKARQKALSELHVLPMNITVMDMTIDLLNAT